MEPLILDTIGREGDLVDVNIRLSDGRPVWVRMKPSELAAQSVVQLDAAVRAKLPAPP